MDRYYISKEPSPEGFHEIHKHGCGLMPPEGARVFLGLSRTSNQAAAVAQNLFRRVCPCSCCLESAVVSVDGNDFLSPVRGGI